jgi:hypothetical protein
MQLWAHLVKNWIVLQFFFKIKQKLNCGKPKITIGAVKLMLPLDNFHKEIYLTLTRLYDLLHLPYFQLHYFIPHFVLAPDSHLSWKPVKALQQEFCNISNYLIIHPSKRPTGRILFWGVTKIREPMGTLRIWGGRQVLDIWGVLRSQPTGPWPNPSPLNRKPFGWRTNV